MAKHARWHEALDAQAEAFAWLDSKPGRNYAQNWADSWENNPDKVHGITGQPISGTGVEVYRMMMRLLPDVILAADTLYVEPDMMTVAESAVGGFEPEPLHQTDLPTPYGFLYLPRPTVVLDRHGKGITVRMFAWAEQANMTDGKGSQDTGILFYLLHAISDRDDYTTEEEIAGIRLLPRGAPLIVHCYPWPYGASIRSEATTHGTLDEASEIVRVIWRLMQQTIGMASKERAPRSTRRRLKPELADRLITVIRLRRPHQDHDLDTESKIVDWSHRWLVGGHWRQHWYPSISMHRQIWISPYVKGPEDKPLMIRKMRVIDLAR